MEHTSAFTLTKQDNGIALVAIDVPGETMNVLKDTFGPQINALLDEIEHDNDITGVVIYSGKDNSFVAGADVSMLEACTSAQQGAEIGKGGQDIFNRIENLAKPVIAAIHGPALGGGLELALACHGRVCSDDAKTQVGLPEVQLGLLPGSGGTQRLPRLISVQKALTMMLTGAAQRPKQALKAGIVDAVVPRAILLQEAQNMALAGKPKIRPTKLNLVAKLLENTALGRKVLFSQARKQTLRKTQGNYPAPLAIIECIETGLAKGMTAGLALEAKRFGELMMTDESKALRSLFFATTEMKKEQGVADVPAKPVQKAAVLGGGLMGGGIAFVTATKAKLPVRIKDITDQGIANALNTAFGLLNRRVKKRILRHSQMQQQLSLITGTTDYSGFKDVDVVIEAVFENLELKQQMVADIENHCSLETIFASNTSSIPISQIAAKAARPENVIGLHYFSPVDKMPLAEVIAHAGTSDQTISTTVALAKKQGKTPIVVKDGAGFYVNRILAPYMSEAANLVLAGEPIDKIDKVMVKFGFPVGPLKLMDEVGIDVGTKIIPFLVAEFGERFTAPDAFQVVIDDDRKGKKNSKGFYDYSAQAKGKTVDESIYTLLGLTPNPTLTDTHMIQRCVYLMLNEAARCLDEGVIRSARDGDIGTIFGIGFPPFLGGPFRYMDKIGIATLVEELQELAKNHGDKYLPAEILVNMSEENKTFY
ncbi:fatty acid oxidation complex subunit alpha FadJ [Opacimonas viscosa]|uniref:enoyl-CoA hydratase n=1 Tax=Opacimonas viscosa TaxID=2961944 RepID=A0AA42BPP3_9ALTE|nr:fatty acid oxidation complex subunit alpha FadJ [Opacimonas viscosa]MCP3428636.1 fatty acid oxidation complex subunit alpha FadJ [Opacimonas viscosa]